MRATLLATVCFGLLGAFVGTPASAQPAPKPPVAEQSATEQVSALPDTPSVTSELEPQPPMLWFESGVGYRRVDGTLEPHLRVGVRGIRPLTETAALYAAFALDGNVTLDMGGWYSFLPGPDDIFGFRSYAGTGLSYAAGSFGVALSAALSYELSTANSLIIVYTHRPLFLPELSQSFDISLGVSFTAP